MSDPGRYDFTIYKGLTFTRVFTYEDAAGDPIDLTGFTAEFAAKPSVTYSTDMINKTDADGLEIDAEAGQITLTLTSAETLALNDDALIYALKVTSGSVVTGLLIGSITVSSEAV